MLRTSILIVSFLFTLLAAQPANAQSYPSLPSRITMSSSARTLKVGQLTEIRLTLINQQGQESAAVEDTPITLTGTKLKDLSSARGEVRENKSLRGGLLELPPGSISTVQGSFAIARGQTGATIRFKSQQSGTIRIFAESEKLVAGSTLIAVLREGVGRSTAQPSAFRTVSFQEAPALPAYSINIESDGSDFPPIINQRWVRKLTVQLRMNGELVKAKEPIEVRLNIERGAEGELSTKNVEIPAEESMSEEIELRTLYGGEIVVSAEAVHAGIARTRSNIPFQKAKRATKLLVDALPPAALANGLEPIRLQVRAVDEGNNPIRAEDEGLSEREIIFRLEGTAFGLKFDQGVSKLVIPKGELAAAINIFGTSPIEGIKIIAESENGSGAAINGTTKVAFSFPLWQFGLAMLGGLLVPPLRELKRRRRLMLTDMAIRAGCGILIGAVFFVLIFYGAAALDGFKWSGIPINLTRLPLHNWVAACTIGILGSFLIEKTLFKASLDEPSDKLTTVQAGLPSA